MGVLLLALTIVLYVIQCMDALLCFALHSSLFCFLGILSPDYTANAFL
jgi:hypothetical protein